MPNRSGSPMGACRWLPAPATGPMLATMSIAWGTVPDWVEAVSTLGALIAAGAAVIAANTQLQHLRDREINRIEAERRQQASHVAVWLEYDTYGGTKVYYSNQSRLPIYNATVVCRTPWGVVTHTEFPVLRPTTQPTPLGDVISDIESTATPETLQNWPSVVNRIQVGIAFQDANEVPWARHPNGYLGETGMPAAAVAALEGP